MIRIETGAEFAEMDCTKQAVMTLFDITDAEYKSMVAEKAFVYFNKGLWKEKINILASMRAYLKKLRKECNKKEDPAAEYRYHKARSAKVKADMDEKASVSAAEVAAMWENETIRAANKLANLDEQIVAVCSPYLIELPNGRQMIDEIRERCAEVVYEVMTELSEEEKPVELEEFGQEDDDGRGGTTE